MRIVTIDIETAPGLAYVWSPFEKFIPLQRIIDQGRVLCLAWKWLDEDEVNFMAEWDTEDDVFWQEVWSVLNEADAVVGFNSKRFDTKHLNRELWLRGYTAPSPYKHIDLLETVKKQFKFMSNKLDNVTAEKEKVRGFAERKLANSGFELWKRVMAGDEDAQAEMEAYNIQDVVTTEYEYLDLLSWIPNHPTMNAFRVDDEAGVLECRCGSTNLQRRGYATTTAGKYRRYHCQDCGSWHRGNRNLLTAKGKDTPDTSLRNVTS